MVVWAFLLAGLFVKVLAWPWDRSVYPIFVSAARHWAAGEALYQPDPAGRLDQYRYSPLVTVCLVPFGLLPNEVGALLWRGLNAFMFLIGLTWWSRSSTGESDLPERRALLLLLTVPLVVSNLNNGQSNLLLLGLLLVGVAAVRDRWWVVAGLCLAGAVYLKLYPMALVLLLAASRPRRWVGWLLLALVGGALLPFLCQRPDYVQTQYGDWGRLLALDQREGRPLANSYRDFRMLCQAWAVPLSPLAYILVQALAAAGAAAVGLVWRKRRSHLRTLFGLGCCWMVLFGPATESSTYVLLAPTLAAALLGAWSQPPEAGGGWRVAGGGREGSLFPPPSTLHPPPLLPCSGWVRGLALGSYGLLLATQVVNWFPPEFARPVLALGPHPLAALLLLAALLVREFGTQSSIAEEISAADGLAGDGTLASPRPGVRLEPAC